MRNSPFRSDLLDGGEGGKAFESMYDERLSERMASDASDTLVQSIVRKIEGEQGIRPSVRRPSRRSIPNAKGRIARPRSPRERTMSRHISDLHTILAQLIAEHRKLLDLLEAQHAAMKMFDLDAMADLMPRQEMTRLLHR